MFVMLPPDEQDVINTYCVLRTDYKDEQLQLELYYVFLVYSII